jgi:hypothetical protein
MDSINTIMQNPITLQYCVIRDCIGICDEYIYNEYYSFGFTTHIYWCFIPYRPNDDRTIRHYNYLNNIINTFMESIDYYIFRLKPGKNTNELHEEFIQLAKIL